MELKIDIWSDCVCPYCYAGKRNLEKAIDSFEHKENVKIIWHSYQLHPELSKESSVYYYDFLTAKMGISIKELKEKLKGIFQMALDAGLEYNLEKAVEFNTFDAHRIIQKAKEKNLGNEMEESFFKSFFTDGKNLNERQVLREIAISTGLSNEETDDALNNDKYFNLIWADFDNAIKHNVEVVPTFFFPDGNKIEAAPSPEIFLNALKKAWKVL